MTDAMTESEFVPFEGALAREMRTKVPIDISSPHPIHAPDVPRKYHKPHPTTRQLEVLRIIVEHMQAHGIAPTLREIGRRLGISSTNGTNDHLLALERKGLIQRQDSFARSIRLTKEGWALLGFMDVPLDAPSTGAVAEVVSLRETVASMTVLLSQANTEIKALRTALAVAKDSERRSKDLSMEIETAIRRASALGLVPRGEER